MTIKEIDNYFLSLERKPQNNCKYTLLYSRQGNAGNKYPFIIFLSPEDFNTPQIDLIQTNNIYTVMEYIKSFLQDHPNIGYFYA